MTKVADEREPVVLLGGSGCDCDYETVFSAVILWVTEARKLALCSNTNKFILQFQTTYVKRCHAFILK